MFDKEDKSRDCSEMKRLNEPFKEREVFSQIGVEWIWKGQKGSILSKGIIDENTTVDNERQTQ